jgi:uncharacterized protein involved in exopolysaccharide biosynthesis
MNTPQTRSLRDYLLPIFRYKGRVLAVLAGSILAAVAWLHFALPEFLSEAKLFVRVGRENAALDPTATTGETINLSGTRETEINSIIEHVRSRAILDKVIAKLKLCDAKAPAEEKEATLRDIERRLYVASPRASTVVTVQCTATSPEKARDIVAALVDTYLDEHMRINLATGSYEFFHEQSQMLKEQLRAAQAKLCDAKNRAQLASSEARRSALENQVSAVETQIQQVQAEISATAAKIAALRETVGALPQSLLQQMVGGTPNDGLARMREQLFQLRMRQEEARSKYTDRHPAAIAMDGQIRDVNADLKEENPLRQEIIAALSARDVANQAALGAQEKSLAGQLRDLRRDLVTLNQNELGIEGLARESQRLENKYLLYCGKMEEARMDQALRADRLSNVNVIQPATFVPTPVRPNKPLILLAAILGGLLASLAMAMFSEQLDPTLRTCEDASRSLGLPGLAAIPHVTNGVWKRHRTNGTHVSSLGE